MNNNIKKVGPYMLCFLLVQFNSVHAEPLPNIIGANLDAVSLYESPTTKKKAKKLPRSDFAMMEVKDVSEDGRRYKVLIDNKAWWVKRTQVKTDKIYKVGPCVSTGMIAYAAPRGAGECTSKK